MVVTRLGADYVAPSKKRKREREMRESVKKIERAREKDTEKEREGDIYINE
jgi:hypothetical protein